jgi:hypothetical protein
VAGLVATVYGFIHVAHSGWNNTQTYVVFAAAIVLLTTFVYFETKVAEQPMMPMRIFEDRNRAGTYLIMLVVGAAMFGMFYFITFFVQGVREYGPLKTGFAFLPVAFVIGIVSQINAKLMPKLGPKPLMITGTTLLTIALFWFASVTKDSSYAGKLLPGMFVLAVAMGCLFVPLTVTAVSNVANTDAGLASALLNVGQQVGGALGLSVMTTVFATAAKNWSNDHIQGLIAQVPDKSQVPAVVQFLQAHGQNVEPKDVQAFIQAHPTTAPFFAPDGPLHTFVRELLAFASSRGFLTGAALGVVAIISAVVLINVKKSDLPADTENLPVPA